MAENEGFSFEEDQAPSGTDAESSRPGEERATDLGDASAPPQKGSRTRILLLLLLLVAVGGAGFYFYVLPASSPLAETPRAAVVVNKKPIAVPPRPAAAKPAEAVAEKKPMAKESVVDKTTQPSEPPAPAAGDDSAVAPTAAEMARADEAEATGENEAEMTPVLAGAKKAVPTTEAAGLSPAPASNYTVAAGAFLLRSNVLAAEEKIQKSGFVAQVVERKKMMEMTRLRVGIFPREEGQRKLEELQEMAPDAFYLPAEGGVAVYAASFQNLDKARLFADRLFELGVRVEEENAQVEIPLYFLSIDGFTSLDSAREAAGTVRAAGLEAMVVRNI